MLPLLIGIVHTAGSPCRCAEAISKGLRALGHEPLTLDSGEIGLRGRSLATACDYILDHTDTYLGKGLYRFMVRALLESYGATVVGSGAEASLVSDNKIACRERLLGAGVPVAPGFAVTDPEMGFPPWLAPPVIVKPSFEHMSRGTTIANSEEEGRRVCARLLERHHQPLLVEQFIPGRELAVSIVEYPEGLRILPVLEWLPPEGSVILDEGFKLSEPGPERTDAKPADLPPGVLEELEDHARHAFAVLGLRDYARFDVRLSPGDSLFFMEANVTPSLEEHEALALSARWAGISYPELIDGILRSAMRRRGSPSPPATLGKASRQTEIKVGSILLDLPRGVHQPAQSSLDFAKVIDVRKGERVLDLGCGSGILSIVAATLGAKEVVAADIDPGALEATLANAARNGVQDSLRTAAGSWFEALFHSGIPGRFDVILATPPQTPAPRSLGPRYGGPDGTRHLRRIIEDAPSFLEPEWGRLWLLLISLANPVKVFELLREAFHDIRVVDETRRYFTPEEYDAYQPGLFDYLLGLRDEGDSFFTMSEKKTCSFRNLFVRASKPKRR